MDRPCSLASGAHGGDDRCGTGHDIASGIHALEARSSGFFIGNDVLVFGHRQLLRALSDQRVRARVHSNDHRVGRNLELRAFQCCRLFPS